MILDKIKEYGLKLSSRRNFSLFSMSCFARAYMELIPKHLNFSYRAFGSIVENKEISSIVNDEYVVIKMGEFLTKNRDICSFIQNRQKVFTEFQSEILALESLVNADPFSALHRIVKIFPQYCELLGVFNCFWRYLGNRDHTNELSRETVEKIAKTRDEIASLWPRFEKVFLASSALVAKSNGFEEDDLHYLTINEMELFIKSLTLNRSLRNEIKKRKVRALYFCEDGKTPTVITDVNLIGEVVNETFPKISGTELKGHSVFAGYVQGKVFNVRETHRNKIETGVILVTSMTSPADIITAKKSIGIVTDEGGILCHAAVIARELKIPCIIGTKTATKLFHTGDLIEVDAVKGVVRKLK